LGAEYFFESYLAFPVVILFFVGYKLWYKQWNVGVKLSDINIDEGRREIDLDAFRAEMDAERAEKASWPLWKRTWDFWL
jgi:amino acid transporter